MGANHQKGADLMVLRAATHGFLLLFLLGWASSARAMDRSVEITLTDDLKPNPLVFRGKIEAPVRLRELRLPLNGNNEQCRGLAYAEVPSAPQVVLTLEKPKRVSIQALPDDWMNPAVYVVKEDRRWHYCVDSIRRPTDFNLAAGRWLVYFAPRAVSKKYGFKLGDETRIGAVSEAPAGTPTLTIESAFRPNPQVFRPELRTDGPAVRDAVYGVRCGDAVHVSEQPSFVLEVREDRREKPLAFQSSHDFVFFDRVTGRGKCVSGSGTTVPLSAGKHYAYVVTGRYRRRVNGGRGWLAVRDETRPLQLASPTREVPTTTLPARLEKPVVISGTSSSTRQEHPLVHGDCRSAGAEPDFFLQTSAPLEDARIQLLGATGTLRLVGPIGSDGTIQAPAPEASPPSERLVRMRALRGRRFASRRFASRARADDKSFHCFRSRGYGLTGPHEMALDGRYAVYVVGEPGNAALPYALRIFQPKTALEPMTRAVDPGADLSIEERALSLWYPDFAFEHRFNAERFERVHRLWMDLPKSLLVFLRTDHEKLKAGTPLLVQSSSGESIEGMTVTGSTHRLPFKQLDTRPPGPIVTPELDHFDLSESDLPQFLSPKASASFVAAQKKFRTCYDRVLDKLDPDGNAGRFAVVTYRGNRVLKVEGLAAKNRRIAGQRCKEKAYEKYVARVAKKESAAQARLQTARAEEVRLRLQALFQK
jgi:hypothetical protein